MRFFITGATGFIGTHLCRQLAADGHHITVLLRSPNKLSLLPNGTEVVKGDLTVFRDPELVLPDADVVIHLAGVIAADTLEQYKAINLDAVQDLVDCLERQKWRPRRLLFASSLAAAGPSEPGRPWTEADPPRPVEPYGAAKAQAEPVVQAASFPTTTFRPPIVLGPGDPASLTLYKTGSIGIGFKVAGTPQVLSWVDVRDLNDGLVLMALDERDGHYTYFTSHPTTINVEDLWGAVSNAIGKRVRLVPVPRPALWAVMKVATAVSGVFGFRNQLDEKQYKQMIAPSFVCSGDALQRDLNWSPKNDLHACTAHAVEGYRALGMLK